MRVIERLAEQRHLLEAGFDTGIQAARFIAQSLEELYEHAYSEVLGLNVGRPEHPRLPPVLHVPRRPGDAVVLGAWRTGDTVVVRRQPGERFARDHALSSPCFLPQSIQAWA